MISLKRHIRHPLSENIYYGAVSGIKSCIRFRLMLRIVTVRDVNISIVEKICDVR